MRLPDTEKSVQPIVPSKELEQVTANLVAINEKGGLLCGSPSFSCFKRYAKPRCGGVKEVKIAQNYQLRNLFISK